MMRVYTARPTQHFDNLILDASKERGGKMMLWSNLPIKKGEEITIDYGYGIEQLKEHYGFNCTCSVCISVLVRSDLAESRSGIVRYVDRGHASSHETSKSSAKSSSESIEAVTKQYNYDRLSK